ncbi:MFS transporter [Allokutzneria albata]|uniref:Predicted arabinose efflux permease, MFS family n=1 Tax=Allokutzneria albata TaxID=211114 RepID=A0A1G9SL12_ALLAB|nr:MFS transporter [Allokutzneria albata]SDM36203.1 Predicted arabinose efflux permease, MFS family [Allokutzneria albata]
MTGSATEARAVIGTGWLGLLAGPMSFGMAAPTLLLPAAASELGVSVAAATWIVTMFGWGITIGTPLAAAVLASGGQRRATLTGAALTVLGSLVLLTAPSLPGLAAASAVQALGSAALMVVAMDLAATPAQMGMITSGLAAVGATGPVVGSLVGSAVSWQAAFALPVLSLLAVPIVLRQARARGAGTAFDIAGAAVLTAFVSALVLIPHQPVWGAVAVVLTGAVLAWRLRAKPDGMVPADVVRGPRFLAAAAMATAFAVINFGMIYAAPGLITDRAGWTPAEIGTALLWPLLLGGALSWLVVAASARVPVAVMTALLLGGGVLAPVLVWSADSPWLTLLGIFTGSLTAASGQGVLGLRAADAVPQRHRGTALGLFNSCYLLGFALGPALAALVTS